MKLWILNTLDVGLDLLDLLRAEFPVQGVIGLSQRAPGDAISGFLHMEEHCRARGLDFVSVDDYTLKNEADRNRLCGLDIDVLVVSGWQRLLPPWLLELPRHCAIGAHGSPFGITGGRGRSPQNWALILGASEFSVSIQRLNAGVDSGEIIDTMDFTYDRFDDIRSSYYKCVWCVARMLIKRLSDGTIARGGFAPQDESQARYLPQRTPEDGAIDWTRSSDEIYNFVRALTRPYPGAFCQLGNGAVLKVWKATPFHLPRFGNVQAGRVVRSHTNGDMLVETGNGLLLINDYEIIASEGAPTAQEGQVLPSADFQQQMRKIIERHQKRHPDLAIAPAILNLLRQE